METITVTARRWGLGWALHIPGTTEPIAQVATLDKAPQSVVDDLDTDQPLSTVTVVPDDEAIADQISVTRQATRDAAQAQQDAARATRDLVAQLHARGYKQADIAGVLGVTRARIYQLLRDLKTTPDNS